MATLECSEKLSVSFIGSALTVKDRSILGTPLVNVLVTCVLFVWVTDGLWRSVELLTFFILPEDEGWSEGGGRLWVQENCCLEGSWPDGFLFWENMVESPSSTAGREAWLETQVPATCVCKVPSSGPSLTLSWKPGNIPLCV